MSKARDPALNSLSLGPYLSRDSQIAGHAGNHDIDGHGFEILAEKQDTVRYVKKLANIYRNLHMYPQSATWKGCLISRVHPSVVGVLPPPPCAADQGATASTIS